MVAKLKSTILISFSSCLLMMGVAGSYSKQQIENYYLIKTFTQNKVKVELSARLINDHDIVLSAFFIPYPGYHMYSTRLSEKGVDGAGRPTKFDISVQSSKNLMISNHIIDEPKPLDIIDKSLTKPIQVYPAGPVKLMRKGTYSLGEYNIMIHITYMSCKDDGGCTVPVENKKLNFTLKISNDRLTSKENP